MNAVEQKCLVELFGRIPQAVAVVAAAVGALVLLGWQFDLDALKSVLPGLTFMKANTAMGFILSGVALWGVQSGRQGKLMRVVAQACAGAVLMLGLLTLAEYLSGADFGIDQLLVREITSQPGDIPGRMAVNTALSFAALGAALLLANLGRSDLSWSIHALVLFPVVAAGSALIGYGYGIEIFLREKLDYTPMAMHTAAVFVLLALGIGNARPDYPFRRLITSGSTAGVTVRRLLPAAIGFTLVTGWLILHGYQAAYFNETFALALFTAASIAGLSTLILWNAGALMEIGIQREQAEEELREYRDHLEELVRQRSGELEQAYIELQELDKLKSLFIATMSHELRTPLNSIIGFTGVILQGMAGPVNEEQARQLTLVKESANHLLSLINDIIDLSKIEAGKADIVIGEFDLAEVAREVADSFAVMVRMKSIELAVVSPATLTAASDRQRIKQILVNLVGNAVKFTDRGRIEILLAGRDGGMEIAVRDTGIGIREEDIGKLFTAFSQIRADGRSTEGTGLGLYLSQKIAHALGGHISVSSEPGKGSRFTLSLPSGLRGKHREMTYNETDSGIAR